ncbi:MAG: hypothetical protein JWR18_1792 [Segetibacter sp.]|nr:hypothetical protein [Segetibacter sp.]
MTTSFKILFMAEVLHDFYKNEECPDFTFIPTEETARLLSNHKALFKTVGNKLIVLIKTDESSKPFVEPKPTEKFSFYMALNEPTFMIVSNLELDDLATHRFYFTNVYQNKAAIAPGTDFLYLTNPLLPFDALSNYQAGDFVKEADVIYEALKTSNGKTPPDPAFWISRNKNQYASKSDLLQYVTKQHSFSVFPNAATVTISVYKLNIVNGLFDQQVVHNMSRYETAVDKISIDLSRLADGKYRVELNAANFFIYISNEAVYNNLFGVIELYNHFPAGDDFAFFDAAGKVKDQKDVNGKNVWLNYKIRFANRVAFWKYVVPKKGVEEFESHPDYSFNGNADPLPSDAFTSNLPIPLQEEPQDFNTPKTVLFLKKRCSFLGIP